MFKLHAIRRKIVNRLAAVHPALCEARVMEALARTTPGLLEKTGVAGLQFTMIVQGRPARTFVAGTACRARGEPMTPRTRFRVASLSKPVAALVFLRAAAAGLIELDSPVEAELRDIPGLRGAAQLGELRLRHLLAHASGVADWHVPHTLEGHPRPTLHEALCGALGAGPRFDRAVGQSSVYSGVNYALAEHVVCTRLDCTFESLAARMIHGVEFGMSARTGPDIASEHDEQGGVLPHWVPISLAASGQVAGAAEIAAVAHQAMRVWLGHEEDAGLPRAIVEPFLTPHPTVERAKFSLGLHRMRRTSLVVWDHGGHRPGMRGSINVIPEACITAVAITNGDRGQEIIEPVLAMIRSICGCTLAGLPRE